MEVPIAEAQPAEEAANPEPENPDSEVPNPVNSQPAAAAEPVEAENQEETEEEKHEEEVQEVLKELPRANLAENPVIPESEQAEPPAQPDEPVAGLIFLIRYSEDPTIFFSFQIRIFNTYIHIYSFKLCRTSV